MSYNDPISLDEFKKGCDAFQAQEKRDSMYKTATFLVQHFWGKPSEIADSLGVLLLTWNTAFYRYGLFDFQKLENCIASNQSMLDGYRKRNIQSLSESENSDIKFLFQQFLEALEIAKGKKQGIRSPVAVAKALHLLAPDFFPIWDKRIAEAYDCTYTPYPADKYLKFSFLMKQKILELQPHIDTEVLRTGRKALKLIDEYNYAKYTWGWI